MADQAETKSKLPISKTEIVKFSSSSSVQERALNLINLDLQIMMGFTDHELVTQRKLEESFSEVVEVYEDAESFLVFLGHCGVSVFKDSKFLLIYNSKEYQEKFGLSPSRAFYSRPNLSREIVRNQEIMAFGLSNSQGVSLFELSDELSNASEAKNGAVFLPSNPDPIIIWHEGIHALQFIAGWEDDYRPKNEFSANLAIIKALFSANGKERYWERGWIGTNNGVNDLELSAIEEIISLAEIDIKFYWLDQARLTMFPATKKR